MKLVEKSQKEHVAAELICLLGVLTAFGPVVTDMYIPAFPDMADGFHTSESMIQMSLTGCMIGLAIGQLLLGPLSDQYGRKPVLIISLAVFVLSTIICVAQDSIISFIICRIFQGLGAAGSLVISRSIASDYYRGNRLAKILSAIGAINGIAPIIAPIVGGFLAQSLGWRSIFYILIALGATLFLVCLLLKESHPKESRSKERSVNVLNYFKPLLHNKEYVRYMLQLSFAQGVLFVNLASSPFIIQNIYGFSTVGFSILFGFNALVLTSAAIIASCFRNVRTGTIAGSVFTLIFTILIAFVLAFHLNFLWYEVMMLGIMIGLGMSFTSSTTMAMDVGRKMSGTASALLGAGCFIIGGIVSPLVGLGNIMNSTAFLFILCAVLSFGSMKIKQ